jgi:hypothetical protein
MNLIERLRKSVFDQEFLGLHIYGVEVSGNNLSVEYRRAYLIPLRKTKEIPISEIWSMVFWEADRFPIGELTCWIEWSGGAFAVSEIHHGFYDFLTELEKRYDQPNVSNRAWAGEIVHMTKDGEPVGRIF